ncbi:MAG: hypothetical protein IJS32_07490 [Kiritimatiellae bacterium]|nr:hypothetical protein [Kiritimatiellia bacterium]
MSKKAARILALLAFVALFAPCRNFLDSLDIGIAFATGWRFWPLPSLGAFLRRFGLSTLAFWSPRILAALLDLLLVRAIHRYLAARGFPEICTDCAARPGRAWTFFALFAVFSVFGVSTSCRQLVCSPSPDGDHPGFDASAWMEENAASAINSDGSFDPAIPDPLEGIREASPAWVAEKAEGTDTLLVVEPGN